MKMKYVRELEIGESIMFGEDTFKVEEVGYNEYTNESEIYNTEFGTLHLDGKLVVPTI